MNDLLFILSKWSEIFFKNLRIIKLSDSLPFVCIDPLYGSTSFKKLA